jgi:hypothetical protein
MMSPALIGALVGLAFAVVEYFWFGALIARAERQGTTGSGPRALDIVRKAQLVFYPLVGFFVGPFLARQLGG